MFFLVNTNMLLWRSTEQVGDQIDHVPGVLQEALVKGLKLHITRTTLSANLMSIWELIFLWNTNYISGQSEWLRLHERKVLSRREVSPTPARARRSRDHFGTDSVRCKLPPLYVPVSPLPVSREASRYLWRSIGASTMVVLKLRTSLSAHPLCLRI